MPDDDIADAQPWKPKSKERPSTRTADEREVAYEEWLVNVAPYWDAIRAAGNQPWWTTEDQLRELYFRRYIKPRPPESPGLSLDLDKIRGIRPDPLVIADNDIEETAA